MSGRLSGSNPASPLGGERAPFKAFPQGVPPAFVAPSHCETGKVMHWLFQHRGRRLIFIANLVSMIGRGMNTAAVTWFILQKTHSEMSLSSLVVLQTIPALLMLPFTGVIIDREDRRRLIM